MASTEKEKQKVVWKKYNDSPKGIARRIRYLAIHESEIQRKRKEKQERRFEKFCRDNNCDPNILRRLMKLEENGVEILQRDPWNTAKIRIWQRGLRRKKKGEEPSVMSLDYS